MEDETDLLLLPLLRASWSLRGQPNRVLISGRNARRVVFGTLNLRNGSRFFLVRERQKQGDFQVFLNCLSQHYPGWHVVLLLDENPCHTAGASQRLAQRLGIELIWLPKRSPELNPMDELWGQAKDVVSANKQYATIDQHAEQFIGILTAMSPKLALATSGVDSPKFWLRSVL